jgi:Cdc6-like AAA superfamily ATPase
MSFENQQSKVLEVVEGHDKKQEYRDIISNLDNYLNRAEPEDIGLFFSILCDMNNIVPEEKSDLTRLFNIVNSFISHMKKDNELFYTVSVLENYLDLTNFIKVYKTRRDFPVAIRNSIYNYLNDLEDYEADLAKQDEDTIKDFNMTAKRVMAVINSYAVDKAISNPQIVALFDKLEYGNLEHQDKLKTSIIHVLARIKYGNSLDLKTENELLDLMDENLKAANLLEKSFLYDVSQGLSENNAEILFRGIDKYVNDYLIHKKGNYTIETMLLDHKIELFYSDYFAKFKFGKDCFIEQLVTHYNKDIFFAFMKRYNIPFNIPIPSPYYKHNEDGDLIPAVDYISLAGLAGSINCSLVKDMVDSGVNVWEHFSQNVVLNDAIYSYSYCPTELDESFSDRFLTFMIDQGGIDHTLRFADENIFYGLLKNAAYVSFVKLYDKTKRENVDFRLSDYNQDNIDMLSFYLDTKPEHNLEKPVIDIFVKEKFDLTNVTSENFTALNYLSANNNETGHLIQALSLLEPLFPDEYRRRPILKKTESTLEKQLGNPHMVSWYNESEMASHIKKSTGGRVAVLESILSKHPSEKPLLRVEDESFFSELEQKLPNFKEVIDYYKGQFRQNYYSDKKRINPILLLGEPGIGKTYFSKEFAQYLKTGYSFIDMGSLTSSWILSGASGTWQDAKQGKILDLLMKSPTFNPIVLLDEVDKTGGGNYNPTVVLYQLLEEINAREFVDEFVDFQFDASGIIYIACANSINTLSDPLLSRFKVFTVPSPTSDQLNMIIKNIYREAIKNNPLLQPEIDDLLVDSLKNNSLREVKTLLEEGVTNALLEYSRKELDEMIVNHERVTLKESHFRPKQVKTSIGF